MRDPNRIKSSLKEVEKIWEKFPDLRLGQLILNLNAFCDIYYLEDDELIEKLQRLYYGNGDTK